MTTPPPAELVPARADEVPAAAVRVELLEQVRAEQPALVTLGDREQLLAAAWLIGYRITWYDGANSSHDRAPGP